MRARSFNRISTLICSALTICALGAQCTDTNGGMPDDNNGPSGNDAPSGGSGTPACVVDESCDDGIFCNGRESCRTGVCVTGQRPCQSAEICNEDTQQCSPAPLFIDSHFDSDNDGWTVSGGDFNGPNRPSSQATDGAPDGQVFATGRGAWYWLAPLKFRGNLSNAYGHTLSFDLNNDAVGCGLNGDQLVVLKGGGAAIYFDAPYLPSALWTNFSVRLDETENWFSSESNQRATRVEILAVLSGLQQLQIRGWFTNCEGTGGLDNVVLNLAANPPPLPAGDRVESHFDDDVDGWTVAGGDFQRAGPLAWNSSDGSPNGHIATNGGGAWYWLAPPKFRGNMSAAYGQDLSFDLNNDAIGCGLNLDQLVVLNGGGVAVYLDAPYPPEALWTNFTVVLDETERWFSFETNERATQAEMMSVLSDLQQLQIRGWFTTCEGGGGLDNVILNLAANTPPPPTGETVESHFDDNADGWAVAGGDFQRTGPVAWDPTGGSPDGHLSASGGGAWYWMAPSVFRGDMSAAYGQMLSFDLSIESVGCGRNGNQLVVLEGGGIAVYFDAPYLPDALWTNFAVRLDETERWLSFETNQRATRREMLAILSNVRQLQIRGWFTSCEGTGGIDNVNLSLNNR